MNKVETIELPIKDIFKNQHMKHQTKKMSFALHLFKNLNCDCKGKKYALSSSNLFQIVQQVTQSKK